MRLPALLLLIVCLPAAAQEKTGAEVYATTCSACHGSGKDHAPLFGSKKQWGKLVREGLDDLVPAALRGIRKMPAKGGNTALSDIEVARGVVHMANAGGGKFAEPTLEDATRWRNIAEKRKH